MKTLCNYSVLAQAFYPTRIQFRCIANSTEVTVVLSASLVPMRVATVSRSFQSAFTSVFSIVFLVYFPVSWLFVT